jgi:hypothetical protein
MPACLFADGKAENLKVFRLNIVSFAGLAW